MAKVNVGLYMEEQDKKIAEKWAKKHDRTLSWVMREALRFYIKEKILEEKKELEREQEEG